MSTKRIALVELLAGQTDASSKALHRVQYFRLKPAASLEVGFFLPQVQQELPDHGADGSVSLRRLDARLSIDIIWQ